MWARKTSFFVTMLMAIMLYHNIALATVTKDSSTPKLSAPTDLLALDVSWWNYFAEQDSKTRQKNLITIETMLGKMPAELQNDLYNTTLATLQLYNNRLTVSDNTIKSPWLISQDKKNYSLKELFDIENTFDELNKTLENQRKQGDRLQATIKEGKKALNTIKSNYLDAKTPDKIQARYQLALQWVHDRLQIALVEHKLSLLYKKDKQLTALIEQGKTLREVANERLNINKEAYTTLKKQRDEQKAAIQKKRKVLTDERLKFIRHENDNVQQVEDREALHDYLLIQLESDIALKQIQLHLTELSLVLGKLFQQGEKVDNTEARRLINTTEQFSAQWRQQLTSLGNDVNTERLNASNRLLSLQESQDIQSQNELLKQQAMNKARVNQADMLLTTLQNLSYTLRQQAFLVTLLENRLDQREGLFQRLLSYSTINIEDQVQSITQYLNDPLFEINETPISTLGILRFFFILLVGWTISRLVRLALNRVAMSRADNNTIAFVLSKILHYIILVFAFLIGLSSLNIDVTRFALLASALSIGIGFGLQNVVSNFVSGIILLFEKSIKVGDFIEFETGVRGQVQEMNIRSTLITTNDNIDIVVPNADFVNGHVTNWTMRESVRRIRVNFGVAYDSDRQKVHDIVVKTALDMPYTLTQDVPEPQVRLVNFGDNSLDFQLLVWIKSDVVKRPGRIQAAYLWAIADVLEKHHIEIPFPQRDIHIRHDELAKLTNNE